MKKILPKHVKGLGLEGQGQVTSRPRLRPMSRVGGDNFADIRYALVNKSFDDSDQEEEIQLGLPLHKEQYLEKDLEPGDTLQTLSIQFNCPVAELKRINNIHRENEVFARRKIKVPVKYYSLLSEKVVGVHKTPQSAKEWLTSNSNESSNNSQCGDNLSVDGNFRDPLRSVGTNIETIYHEDRCANCDGNNVSSITPLIPNDLESHSKAEVFQCNGSDWGLSWLQLLFCTLLLGFAAPLVYIFYLKEALDVKHSNHTISITNTSVQVPL